MKSTIRHRIPAAAAVASVALLVGAGGVSAALPSTSISANVRVGQNAAEVDSDALTRSVSKAISYELASTQRKLKRTQKRLDATRRRALRLQRQLRARANGEVRATPGRIRIQLRSARSRIDSLRAQVRKLRSKAVGLGLRLEKQAIDEARASANGAWLVVDRTGRILDQSGGMSVEREGTGTYNVGYDVRRSPCLGLLASGPAPSSIFGTVRISPASADSLSVSVSGPRGPRDGGFYFAATC